MFAVFIYKVSCPEPDFFTSYDDAISYAVSNGGLLFGFDIFVRIKSVPERSDFSCVGK